MTRRSKNLAVPVAALLFGSVSSLPLAAASFTGFVPGNIVVSRSVYTGTASTVTVGQALPPSCPTTATCAKPAVADGEFPNLNDTQNVWNNDTADGSFGVTSPIFLDQMTPTGTLINTLTIPTTQIVTSFSSKSELALNLSTDGTAITFMGYLTTPNQLDVSNSNTPGVYDPTNPVGISVSRAVAQVDPTGYVQVTPTNAYSGNNGRAAILANGLYYTAGNDNNGKQSTSPVSPVLQQLINATGVQIVNPAGAAGNYQQAATFSITQYGYAADKPGKDMNFRGLTIFNNTLYLTKGSGGNGIDTVYQVGTPGSLPNLTTAPTGMTILPGFQTSLVPTANVVNYDYPFGIWFANANTLYVADEGDGVVADAAISTHAGLQKWILNNGTWTKAYTMQNGLNLGVKYSVASYPTSLNPAPAGLRNLTGRVNGDGTVTLWAVTSTVSANGDQGADPNQLVTITDVVANTDPSMGASEQFTVLETAAYGQVLRGVSLTPTPDSAIGVTSSSLIYSRAAHAYNGTLTITNNGSSVYYGTVVVSLENLSSGATLLGNPPVANDGSPEVVFTSVTLQPGQSASAPISFSDPSNARIQFTPAVQ